MTNGDRGKPKRDINEISSYDNINTGDSINAKRARKNEPPKWLHQEISREASKNDTSTSDKDIHDSDSLQEPLRASSSEKDSMREKAEKKVEELTGNVLKTLKEPLIGELNYCKSQYIDILSHEIKTKSDFKNALWSQEMKDKSDKKLTELKQERTILENIKFEEGKLLPGILSNFQGIISQKISQEEAFEKLLKDKSKNKMEQKDENPIISLLSHKIGTLIILNDAYKRLIVIRKEVNHLQKIENTGIDLQMAKEELLSKAQQENVVTTQGQG